ncbi:ankyrin, partial [Ascobolus immersus RN42]
LTKQGAKPSELLLEAARRNNPELLNTLLPASDVLLNESRDALGNTALHLAAASGATEIVDILLDQDGLEVDPINRLDGYTPLHISVLYAEKDAETAHELCDLLLDAGADPRVRSKGGRKAIELVDPRNKELRELLQKAEWKVIAGADVVDDSDDGGSGSESD